MLPSGSTLLKLRAVMILFTSLSILLATPGYWKIWLRDFYLNLLCFVIVHCCFLPAIARLTWIFMATSLPSFSLAKCTWPIDAAANGFSSKYSSLSLQCGPRSLLMAFCREGREKLSHLWAWFTEFVLFTTALSPYCTIICLEGMKSALCRTRSKILASWGLMKASSERRENKRGRSDLTCLCLLYMIITFRSEFSICFSKRGNGLKCIKKPREMYSSCSFKVNYIK